MRYINPFEYRNKQFSIEQQVLEFYIIYKRTIFKLESLFADKIKEQGS